MKTWKTLLFLVLLAVCTSASAQLQNMSLVNEPLDISNDFTDFKNTYYLADKLIEFDGKTGEGIIEFDRYEFKTRYAFNNMLGVLSPASANEFPEVEYEASPAQKLSIDFAGPGTVRIRIKTGIDKSENNPSLMLVNGFAPEDNSWKYRSENGDHIYEGDYGSVIIYKDPWRIAFYNSDGDLLTQTVHHSDNDGANFTPVLPFSYVRRASDYSRSFNAAFELSPSEKIFGTGESYTELNKRGQKVVLWTDDANGVQNETSYKPIPFYLSSRGYGVFMHTSSPITCDFGKYISNVNAMMIGDETLDLFVFLGEPKEVLDAYTDLTGKPAMPPLWSFGLWMSRITYSSEEEGREVARQLRDYKIPCDVIHYDVGWFETDWRCDYEFAPSRFEDAKKMMSDLKKKGFEISLWQLPYFVPKNNLFSEIVEKELYVKNAKGNLPYEDAILDFSNEETINWYQKKIGNLLEMGVGAIKVDFGEAAPEGGIYASGKTGFYEHNLYPLRYNKAVANITKEITGEQIMWARSAWAGSQRYPVHWGGDPANTNSAMAASLRGGLSIGLSGFSFWSHDIGGFVLKTPEDVYRRWTPFGMLTSHTRSHGAPPKEPWEYSDDFLKMFREADNMRYELMPYIFAQAKHCSETGLPMMRALFVEYPEDPGSWLIDDQYLFGSDMLVAPLFENVDERSVYLPKGEWVDYQTGRVYSRGWHSIKPGSLPIVVLVRSGALIPHINLAQSTKDMDWTTLKLVPFGSDDEKEAMGKVFWPDADKWYELKAEKSGDQWKLVNDNLPGSRIKFSIVEKSDL